MGLENSHTFEAITFGLPPGWLEDEWEEDGGEVGQTYVIHSSLGRSRLEVAHVLPPYTQSMAEASSDIASPVYQQTQERSIVQNFRLLDFDVVRSMSGVVGLYSLVDQTVRHPASSPDTTMEYKADLFEYVGEEDAYSFLFRGGGRYSATKLDEFDKAYPPEHPLSLIKAALATITLSAAKVISTAA